MEPPELRYRDCPSVEVTETIAASPDRVWELVSDIGLPARFSDELLGAEWLDGSGPPAVGRRFVGRNQHPAIGQWETTSIIRACDPGRVFEWAVTDADEPSSVWRYTLAPDDDDRDDGEDGRTRLTMWMQMGPAPSGINIAIDAMPDKESKILHRRLAEHAANMAATLAGIKALAES